MNVMMSDRQFAELELRATICPGQCEWPKPEYVHWQKLHEAANEARANVTKAYTEMDKIDRNASLSSDIKYRRRCEIADQAIADFEASKTLARARQAIELAMAKYQVDQQVSPEIAQDSEATLKAMKELERGWPRAMEKIAERASLTKGLDTRR
jgi:cell division FtsZ-interacting protein ZapD